MKLEEAREKLDEYERTLIDIARDLACLLDDIWELRKDPAVEALYLETRKASVEAANLSSKLTVIRINMLPRVVWSVFGGKVKEEKKHEQ